MEAQAAGRNLEIVLLHELSSGTFARLYLAEARAPGGIERIVAVKILREQWNESDEVINRTRDEARLLARLRHKNILRVEDLSEIDGQLAIIMEFVDGLDLKQLVEGLAKRKQKLPPRAALQIVADTAAALEAAYFKVPYGLDSPLHVVHRDIKPSNIMVSIEGELKVLDFGTARSSQAFRSVQTGALRFGSLKYMSPERREGDRGEHAADVYALGLVLLEILKGEWLPLLPMDVTEHDEVVAEEVTKLGSLGMPNREWDIALRQVLLQMLAGDAAQRPNAEQVAKLLRAFAEQAAGDSLDSFAHETIAPLTRQVRGNLTGGALAGTRFVVSNFDPNAGRGEGRAKVPPATKTPPPPARTEEPVLRPATPVRPAEPTWAPPPREDQEPTVRHTYDSAPPEPIRPRVEVSHVATAPQPAPAKGGGGMMIAGGALVVLLVFGCTGTLALGGVWYFLRSPGQVAEPAVAAPLAPVTASVPSGGGAPTGASIGPAAAATASVSVTMTGAPVQWIRLLTAGGAQVLSGSESLTGAVPADTYQLALKQVGRPALKGELTVPAAGATLTCAPAKDASVECSGLAAAVVLKP